MNELNLDNYVERVVGDIQASIQSEVLDIAQNALINALNKTVYLQQKQYRQTRDLLGAVEISNLKIGKQMATFSVIINAKKMGIEMRHPDLNAHASAGKNGKDFREQLIEVLDEGTKTFSPIYMHPAHGFFDMAYDDMDKKIIMSMAQSLRSKGYKVDIY